MKLNVHIANPLSLSCTTAEAVIIYMVGESGLAIQDYTWCRSCTDHTYLYINNVFLVPLSAHNNSLTTYEVQYRGVATLNTMRDNFNRTITASAGVMLSYDILDLMAYSTYNVSVRATNQYGVGNFSEEVTVQTEEGGKYALH